MITLENRINAARGIMPITQKQRRTALCNARIRSAIRNGMPIDPRKSAFLLSECAAVITMIALFAGISSLFVERL